MRNFTNDPIFDDTLPISNGLMEVGFRVPLDRLQSAMKNWFQRKGYLRAEEQLQISISSEVSSMVRASGPNSSTS